MQWVLPYVALAAQLLGVWASYGVARQAARQRGGFALFTGWFVGALVMALPLWLAGFPEAAGGTIILFGLPAAWLGKRRGKASAADSQARA